MSDAYDTIREKRMENPTGWLRLTHDEDIQLMIDAMLCYQPEETFTLQELCSQTGVETLPLKSRFNFFMELGIVEIVEVADDHDNYFEESEYRFDESSLLGRQIVEMNSIMNALHEEKDL